MFQDFFSELDNETPPNCFSGYKRASSAVAPTAPGGPGSRGLGSPATDGSTGSILESPVQTLTLSILKHHLAEPKHCMSSSGAPSEGHGSGEITIRAATHKRCQLLDEFLLDQADR